MLPSKKKSGRTLAEIDAELAALHSEREAVRAAEVQDVIARIKQAIEHYGLTADDLGLTSRREASRQAAGVAAAKTPKTRTKWKTATAANPPKYSDGAGKTWTGRGKRPAWFVEALAAGKSADDLLIKPVG